MKKIPRIILCSALALLAGCGGGTSTSSTAGTASVSGIVADGYLEKATVFLDKNLNFQLDPGEPSAVTDANGGFTLTVDPNDVGKYPLVALATQGVTVDKDTGTPVTASYVLCLHALSVVAGSSSTLSGTVSNVISPISSLVQEKMAAGATLTDALAQVRTELGLPAGMNPLGDYVAGSQAGQPYQADCLALHTMAQQMVGLMAEQSSQFMTGQMVNATRYRAMLNGLNANLNGIAQNVRSNAGMQSSFMYAMRTRLQNYLATQSTSTTTTTASVTAAAVPYSPWPY